MIANNLYIIRIQIILLIIITTRCSTSDNNNYEYTKPPHLVKNKGMNRPDICCAPLQTLDSNDVRRITVEGSACYFSIDTNSIIKGEYLIISDFVNVYLKMNNQIIKFQLKEQINDTLMVYNNDNIYLIIHTTQQGINNNDGQLQFNEYIFDIRKGEESKHIFKLIGYCSC